MSEELYIQERVGKRNPFQVPEGYFDDFAARVMQSIGEAGRPEQRQQARTVRMHRPLIYAVAACVSALLISTAVYLSWPGTETQASLQLASQQETYDTSFDEAADYMMLDNHDIYACLADY